MTAHDAPDDYRPRTTPGVYVPTPITAASIWPEGEAVRHRQAHPNSDQSRRLR